MNLGPAALAQSGGFSFQDFFLLVGALFLALVIVGIVIGMRTRPQDAMRHKSLIGAFEPGVVGNLQKRVLQAGAGNASARQWVGQFVKASVEDAVALRHRLNNKEAHERIKDGKIDDLPRTVQYYLDGSSLRKRWKLRRTMGVRPRVPRTFSLERVFMPWHVSKQERYLQDLEGLMESLGAYAKGGDAL